MAPGILSTVIYVESNHGTKKTLCILDTAAAQSTIDRDFALSLGLTLGKRKQKTLAYLDRQVNIDTFDCQVKILSQDMNFSYLLKAEAVTGFSKNCMLWPWSNFLGNHPHLKNLVVPSSPLPPVGTILIGTDNSDLLTSLEYRKSVRPRRPIGIRTPLGWGFFGPDPPGEEADPGDVPVESYPLKTYKSGATLLAEVLSRQFELENLGAKEEEPPPHRELAQDRNHGTSGALKSAWLTPSWP